VDVGRAEPLYVREDPHHLSPIVLELRSNATNVEVYHCIRPSALNDPWCFLSYNGRQGWANARYLRSMTTGAYPNY
jgi:uncharacterized protein YraI